MKFLFGLRVVAVAFIVAIATGRAYACKCGGNIHGKNAWDTAKLETQAATAVFEGVPEKVELQWSALSAKEGDLLPANVFGDSSRGKPRMLLTLRVQHAYKGELGPTVQVGTGFGGGDCAARFSPGLTYLVYAYGPTVNELRVSMCSPGGWIGESSVAAYLRYLRKRHPIASDFATPEQWSKDPARQEREVQRNFEEYRNRHAAATGKICGAVITEKTKDPETGIISFFSTIGHSPVEFPTAQVSPDGSFCSEPLGPGKYHLFSRTSSNQSGDTVSYYPGVLDSSQASTVEIAAGQTLSDISFKIPKQSTASVFGFVSVNDNSGLSGQGAFDEVSVVLIPADGNRQLLYTQVIDFQGIFPLPKVRFFRIANVLPGRYFAYVSFLGKDWFTRKVEVNVADHTKFISLELVHKK